MKPHFTLPELLARHRSAGRPWMEFLRAGSLSMGIYVLPAGAPDRQQPHTEDEVYYVVGGRAVLGLDGGERPVGPGSIVFVPKGAAHRFHSVTEELTALVFFAPSEGSLARGAV